VPHVAGQLEDIRCTILDLNDFEVPIYSADRERDSGFPERINDFASHLEKSDGVVISLAEHNGSYSVAFKNVLDWLSRAKEKAWAGKTLFLMATSPGGRGGAGVLQTAAASFPRFGADLVATFSLPSFHNNFSEDGVTDRELRSRLLSELSKFSQALH
jgi:chromate reductase